MALFQFISQLRATNESVPSTPSVTPAPQGAERPASPARPVTRDAERWAATLLAQLDFDSRQR